MRRRKGSIPHRLLAAAIGALVALALVPGMGAAAKNPVTDVTETLEKTVKDVTGGSAAPSSAPRVPSEPTQDDDSPGHESPNPTAPDHASGGIADIQLGDDELVTVGHTDSTIANDDSSSSDVTVLAVGGEEIVGAHSDSENGPKRDTHDPLSPVCDESGGAVCLGLLFAEASSSENANSSNASSSAALAFACLGGTQTDATDECDGPVSAGVAESSGDIERDKRSGETEASHSSDLADVCVGGTDVTGTCTVFGAEAAHSESHSESGPAGGRGFTERDSFLLNVEANGEDNEIIGDPTAISIPPDCPEGTSLVCLFFNQGESFVFVGGAASYQEVAHVQVGPDLVLGHLATSETLATNAGPDDDDVVEGDPPLDDPGDTVLGGGPGGAGDASGDALPFTGVGTSILLAIAFALISAGAWLLALRRRPQAQLQQ